MLIRTTSSLGAPFSTRPAVGGRHETEGLLRAGTDAVAASDLLAVPLLARPVPAGVAGPCAPQIGRRSPTAMAIEFAETAARPLMTPPRRPRRPGGSFGRQKMIWLFVAAGGAAGAVARYATASAVGCSRRWVLPSRGGHGRERHRLARDRFRGGYFQSTAPAGATRTDCLLPRRGPGGESLATFRG